MEADAILIRPDPDNMELAFRADELLQQLVPKHRVRFLLVRNQQVRAAIKQRGEYWRISPLPKTPDEMKRMIADSKIAIHGRELYYYSKTTGTRFLTYQSFAQLGALEETALRQHLAEIREFSAGVNRHGRPEVAFFMAGKAFLEGRLRRLRFRRPGCGGACERPTKRCGRSSATPSRRVPPRRPQPPGMAERDVRRADRRGREGRSPRNRSWA